jgi:hypothetical protein
VRARFRWRLPLRPVTGDARSGSEERLQALETRGLRADSPVSAWEPTRPYCQLDPFASDAARDRYVCPQGQLLRYLHSDHPLGRVASRAPAAGCNACPVKARRTPSDHGRLVHRSFPAELVERGRGYRQTPADEEALRKRKVWVEPLCAEAKQWRGLRRFRLRRQRRFRLRRFRLRRLWRVNCEALVLATG